MFKIIRREIYVVILVGVSPIFIAYWFGGTEKLQAIVTALLAQEFSIYHALILTAIFFAAKSINHFFNFYSDMAGAAMAKVCATFEEVGNATLCMLRVGTGVLIGFPALWYMYDSETFNATGFVFLVYGAVAFIDVCLLSLAHEYIKKKWRGHALNNEIKNRHSGWTR